MSMSKIYVLRVMEAQRAVKFCALHAGVGARITEPQLICNLGVTERERLASTCGAMFEYTLVHGQV